MNDIVGTKGELRMTIAITRKDTGLVETYDLVGVIDPSTIEKNAPETLGENNVNNPLDSSPQRGH